MKLIEAHVHETFSNIQLRAATHIFYSAFHYTKDLLTVFNIFFKGRQANGL
jgi:hypothetical protein